MSHEKYLQALLAFERAAFYMSKVWDECADAEDAEDYTETSAYPFKQSFDEVCLDIRKWRMQHEIRIQQYTARMNAEMIILYSNLDVIQNIASNAQARTSLQVRFNSFDGWSLYGRDPLRENREYCLADFPTQEEGEQFLFCIMEATEETASTAPQTA